MLDLNNDHRAVNPQNNNIYVHMKYLKEHIERFSFLKRENYCTMRGNSVQKIRKMELRKTIKHILFLSEISTPIAARVKPAGQCRVASCFI